MAARTEMRNGQEWTIEGDEESVEYEQELAKCDGSGDPPDTAVRMRKTFRHKEDGSLVLLSIADVGKPYPIKR